MRDDVKSCVTHNAFLTSAVIQSIHRVLWTTDEYTRNFTFHTSVHYEMEIEGVCWCDGIRFSLWELCELCETFLKIIHRSINSEKNVFLINQIKEIVSHPLDMLTCIFLILHCCRLFWLNNTRRRRNRLSNMKNVTKNGRRFAALWPMKSLILLVHCRMLLLLLQNSVLKKKVYKTWRAISPLTDVVLIDLNFHANFTYLQFFSTCCPHTWDAKVQH